MPYAQPKGRARLVLHLESPTRSATNPLTWSADGNPNRIL
jgi:hypothetical protein